MTSFDIEIISLNTNTSLLINGSYVSPLMRFILHLLNVLVTPLYLYEFHNETRTHNIVD